MLLKDRFDDEQTELLREMALFAFTNFKRGSAVTQNQIVHLTEIDNLGSDALVLESLDFCEAFSSLLRYGPPKTTGTSDKRRWYC